MMRQPTKFLSLLAFIAIVGFANANLHAFDIAWSVGGVFKGFDGHLNVSTAGEHIRAVSFGEDVDRSINVGSETIEFEGVLDASSAPETFDGGSIQTQNTVGSGNPEWNNIMRFSVFSTTNTGDFQLTDLSVGDTYQVEIFTWYFLTSSGGGQQQFWSDEEGNDSATFTYGDGQSIIGTFVADATTELIKGTMVTPTDDPVVTAYSLRRLAQIPEPGSCFALAILGVGVSLRRRRR